MYPDASETCAQLLISRSLNNFPSRFVHLASMMLSKVDTSPSRYGPQISFVYQTVSSEHVPAQTVCAKKKWLFTEASHHAPLYHSKIGPPDEPGLAMTPIPMSYLPEPVGVSDQER